MVTKTVHLVRHGSHVLPPGILAGRLPGAGVVAGGDLLSTCHRLVGSLLAEDA